ncbi:RNA-binding protein [Grosmannia clavigera kw1407]|uniref:RNA-binding protein n=1 Tax=Grosmannia clavigera (strain kw1407 / UAMH 11150) TaxID=655863 RepID=F0XRJ6_GROCL|nr:RNA-binding protein [Grosmannia clavigera kw1407]EFW99944.1 RNA-binding protein [Grosmannia clavigera kw1407]
MATNMDRSLDEILADRKSYRDDPRKIDDEWVHDRYDDDGEHLSLAGVHTAHSTQRLTAHRFRPARKAVLGRSQRGTKIRVENIHYELTKEDIEGLFRRIGPVLSTELVYDRAGRSDGVAYVTYEIYDDAKEAIREFDGANAKGQPIRLSIVPSGRRALDNPAKVGTGRPLAERVSRPGRGRNDDNDEDDKTSMAAAARRGIDRYVPRGGGGGDDDRSRSPRPRRREGGRRPGERRGEGRGGGGGEGRGEGKGEGRGEGRTARQNRPKKTQEELDAEMEDYFGGEAGGGGGETAAAAGIAVTAPLQTDAVEGGDDMDMIG